jgi:NAD(P)-dependent dehydrogenase (short-subunit alcohol dehydrogenase family)
VSARLAVVTGGNRGIGRACAERLLRTGHRVTVTGRDAAALDETVELLRPHGDIEARAFDVADEGAVEEAIGGLDVGVLVANAGVGFSEPIHRTTLEDWRWVLDVNLTGVFLCVRAVIGGMRERDRGRIVVIASVASHHGVRYGSAYSASKHGVLGLVRSVATEVAGTGVTANAVCPAFVKTEMTDRSIANIVERTGMDEEDARAALERMAPLGRLVTVDEVAAAVSYLASEGAAPVNGQSIILDGGGIQQ